MVALGSCAVFLPDTVLSFRYRKQCAGYSNRCFLFCCFYQYLGQTKLWCMSPWHDPVGAFRKIKNLPFSLEEVKHVRFVMWNLCRNIVTVLCAGKMDINESNKTFQMFKSSFWKTFTSRPRHVYMFIVVDEYSCFVLFCLSSNCCQVLRLAIFLVWYTKLCSFGFRAYTEFSIS